MMKKSVIPFKILCRSSVICSWADKASISLTVFQVQYVFETVVTPDTLVPPLFRISSPPVEQPSYDTFFPELFVRKFAKKYGRSSPRRSFCIQFQFPPRVSHPPVAQSIIGFSTGSSRCSCPSSTIAYPSTSGLGGAGCCFGIGTSSSAATNSSTGSSSTTDSFPAINTVASWSKRPRIRI